MNFENTICRGCNMPMQTNEDVVVCPECGTPQHRECYNKEGRCVNSALHGTDYDWKKENNSSPSYSQSAAEKTSDGELLPCPACGHLNPADAEVCENCNTKLFIMGMNIARSLHEKNQHTNAFSNIPDCPAPFTVGEGEGFDYSETTDTEKNLQNEINRKNAKRSILFHFIGNNSDKYFNAFDRIDRGKKLNFHFASAFFMPYWFFYRKLIKPGIIFMTLLILSALIFTPTMLEILEITESYSAMGDIIYTDETVMNAWMAEIEPHLPLMIMSVFFELGLRIAAGFLAYPLYKKYADSSADKIAASPDPKTTLLTSSRSGGTSFFYVFIAYMAYYAVTYITDIIIFG